MRRQLILGLLWVGLVSGTAAEPPLDLKLRLQPGASYRLEVRSTQQLAQAAAAGGTAETTTLTVGYTVGLRVLAVDSAGVATIAMTYLAARLRQEQGGQVSVDYDSGRAQGEIPLPALGFAGLVGVEFVARLKPDGEVVAVTVPQDAAQDVVKRVGGSAAATTAAVAQAVAASVNEQTVRDCCRGFTRFLPPRPVAVGDTWQTVEAHPGPLALRGETTWTLKARDHGLAIVSVQAQLRPPPAAGTAAAGAPAADELAGEEAGIIVVRESTGLVVAGTIDTGFRGTLAADGEPPAARLSLTVTGRTETKGVEAAPRSEQPPAAP